MALVADAQAELQARSVLCRPDTFSLGICNGCQLMALLGWVPGSAAYGANGAASSPFLPDEHQPRFIHNQSGRFESRWTQVHIQEDSPAVMLKVRCCARWCAWEMQKGARQQRNVARKVPNPEPDVRAQQSTKHRYLSLTFYHKFYPF